MNADELASCGRASLTRLISSINFVNYFGVLSAPQPRCSFLASLRYASARLAVRFDLKKKAA
ncbi:hypothetical protein DSM37_16860 [Salmonella enterica subsp. enterica serovar Kisangani]|nr:hypothetical protein [Salmonella enterica subsp. enterica serovar Kisangani]